LISPISFCKNARSEGTAHNCSAVFLLFAPGCFQPLLAKKKIDFSEARRVNEISAAGEVCSRTTDLVGPADFV